MKYLFLILINLFSGLHAQEVNYLARSPRALLMGDAFTAIADDEFTLFYNPAALGRNKGVSFTLLDPNFGLTDALSESDRFLSRVNPLFTGIVAHSHSLISNS